MTEVRLVIAVTIAAIGLAACSGDDGGDDGGSASTETSSHETSTSTPVHGAAILIETRVTSARSHTGEVSDGSVIGESEFCHGGTTGGSSQGPTITTTFTCPDGTLEVQYAPTQPSLVQSAAWEIVGGTGSFEGLRGGGYMAASFLSDNPDAGREVFTGTVGT